MISQDCIGNPSLKNNFDTQNLDILKGIEKENTFLLFLAITIHSQSYLLNLGRNGSMKFYGEA